MSKIIKECVIILRKHHAHVYVSYGKESGLLTTYDPEKCKLKKEDFIGKTKDEALKLAACY